MIHLDVAAVGVFLAHRGDLEVLVELRAAIRIRNQLQHARRDGADAVRRNPVAGKRCAAHGLGIARGRIINGAGGRREVAVAECQRGNCADIHVAAPVANALEIGEVEGLVLANGAAQRRSEKIVRSHRLGGGEKAARAQAAHLIELKRRAVQRVCAGLEIDVGDGAAGAAEFGLVV